MFLHTTVFDNESKQCKGRAKKNSKGGERVCLSDCAANKILIFIQREKI